MCGRYTLAKGERVIEVVQNVTMKEDLRAVGGLFEGRWNIAPGQDVLVVSNRVTGGAHEAEGMRWGLVPHWAKESTGGYKMINARAETLATKPAFRENLKRRRCVLPADGFYEWRKEPVGGKTPMYIRMKDGRAFGFAGLWDEWRDEKGELLRTCTIVTTDANELLKDIHDRMPVILTAEGVKAWLDPQERPAEELVPWLAPYPGQEMEAYAVGRGVNNVAHEGQELVRKAPEEEERGQKAELKSHEPEAGGQKSVGKVRKRQEDPRQGRLF